MPRRANRTSFKLGHPKLPGAGRKKGTPNRRTLQKREFLELMAQGDDDLPAREERFKEYLRSMDKGLAFACDKELLAHAWGRPRESVEIRDRRSDSAADRLLQMIAAIRERK